MKAKLTKDEVNAFNEGWQEGNAPVMAYKPKAHPEHPDPALAGERAARRDAAKQAEPFSQEKKNLKAQVLNALRLSQNRMEELAEAPLSQDEIKDVTALSNQLDDLIMVFCEQLIAEGK